MAALAGLAGYAFLKGRQTRVANTRLAGANTQLAESLALMEVQKAEEFFSADHGASGVAHLVRVLRQNPAQRVAAERLYFALTQRGFAVPLSEPLRHQEAISSAQFSADGQRVVTASWDKTARVWDARTGQPVGEPLRHEAEVWSVQFSPDGQRVVTASNDNTARVWDARTGQPVGEPLRHKDTIASVQFSPDGQRVVTASEDNTARVWDARTGQPLSEPLRHEDWVWSAQFSPDGQRVVTASADKTARVWETPTVRLPVPDWFLRFAEALGGERINERGALQSVGLQELQRMQREVAAAAHGDFYGRVAQWILADRATRPPSPFSTSTAGGQLKEPLKDGRVEAAKP